jgi:hypothetical protein
VRIDPDTGRPGKAVAHLIGLYLWTGPTSNFADELAAAVAADAERTKEQQEQEQRVESEYGGGRASTSDLGEPCAKDPILLTPLLRDLVVPLRVRELSKEECERQVKRARRRRAPKWRAGDATKCRKWLQARDTIECAAKAKQR